MRLATLLIFGVVVLALLPLVGCSDSRVSGLLCDPATGAAYRWNSVEVPAQADQLRIYGPQPKKETT